MHFTHINTDGVHPFQHFIFKICKMFFPIFATHKVFYFHLLKFSLTENKISRSNFISKCFTNLSNTKR